MGFLDNLFTSKTNNNEKRLVDCVEKIENSEYGVFVNIMNDLGKYIEKIGENDSQMSKMAYAYARRMAAAGLCAQGIWGQEEFNYTNTVFQSFQQSTAYNMNQLEYQDTIKFQEEAAEQATELIQSYDSRFDKKTLMTMTTVMMRDASRAKNSGKIFTINDLLVFFKN